MELGCPRTFCNASCAGPLTPARTRVSRKRLFSHVVDLCSKGVGEGLDDHDITAAIAVEPKRVALPESAATIDPARILRGDRRCTYLAWEASVRLDESEWPTPLTRPCHRIGPEDELELLKRLVLAGLGEFCPAGSLPVDPSIGEPLVSGWFCV